MAESESDEFYEELRRKLSDYGSQPPEEVWAGIRRQLPKPVPRPALRARRVGRRGAVLGVAALLLVSSVVLRFYDARPKALLTTNAPLATGAGRPLGAHTLPHPSVSSPTSSAASAATATPAATVAPKTQPTAPAATQAPAALPTGTPATAQSGALQSPRAAGGAVAARPNRRAFALAVAPTRRKGAAEQTAKRPARRVARKEAIATALEAAAATQQGTVAQSVSQATNPPAAASNQPEPRAAGRTGALASREQTASPDLTPLLAAAPVALVLSPLGPPSVTAVVGPAPAPPVAARRLAVQLLGGPALSYRYLGVTGSDSVAGGVARLERPALSYSVQLGLTYALTPRFTLGTGLGYSEYATGLNLRVKQVPVVYASFNRPVLQYTNGSFNTLYVPDSVASGGAEQVRHVRHRDTYHFLTLPVQVQYQLGAHGRLSYGLLLGSTLNLYVGGRTTEASGCGCEQNSWDLSGSSFRVASLGLLAGAALDYRLSRRWRLTLQPTLHYLATPLTKDQTGPTRQLYSASLRTGVIFDLR